MKDHPISYEAYRKLAKRYAEIIDVKPHNAEYERPALLRLMPDVKGKRVLDAGCGTGSLTEWLLDKGAEVIGVDASPHMLQHAEERVGGKARLVQHNLDDPLSFLENNTIDLIALSLVMHYIKNLEPLFHEFHRILKPGGELIFSLEHPISTFHDRPSDNYYEPSVTTYDWRGFTEEPVAVPSYRRALQDYTESLANAGFTIERLLEPKPSEKFKKTLPESYARHLIYPSFMVIKARAKPPSDEQPD